MYKDENTRETKYMKNTVFILGVSLALLFTACSKSAGQEEVSVNAAGEITSDENMLDGNMETDDPDDVAVGYEGEWYRTDVASYQWARIVISDWKEGESFDVTLDAMYSSKSGVAEGTATFIEEDMAVLYDEDLETNLQNKDGDHGIYFHFLEDSIEVTHDAYVRSWFGGGGGAAGTYIQGEVEYTNCTDVSEIFTENELEQIQELLGEKYDPLFKNLIEFGEIKEYPFDKVCMWMAYSPDYSERCYITIYEDGQIYIEYIERHFDSDAEKEFYTNSKNAEMPDDELLSVEWEEIKALDIPEDMLAYWMVLNSKMPFISYGEGNQEFYWDEYFWLYGSPSGDDRERWTDYDEFVLADLNNDGGNELILYYGGVGYAEVFHYEDNAVYGFQSVFRHMNPVYTNGIYGGSDSAAHGYYSQLTELDKDGYAEETVAEFWSGNVDNIVYEIGGVSVSQEEYEEFQQNIEETGRAEDIPYVGLDACLLGGLSEEELYMVKHVEVLPMNDSLSYPMEPEIRQAYYGVLTGEKELISVTDDQQRFYLDDYQKQNGKSILYFSIVDMDQDGIYEVVLSCSHDTTQILHYADGDVYSYRYHYGGYGDDEIGIMSNQGIFEMGSIYEDRKTTYHYGKIVSFTEDGCDIQEVGQSDERRGDWYDRINDDRIRYHYFSEELIEQYFR